jgi:hypothetical protein
MQLSARHVASGHCDVRFGPMSAQPKHKMTVDEYLAWAQGRPGRFELYAGVVYAMTPGRAGHAKVKFAVQAALRSAIQRSRLPCHLLPDGMTHLMDGAAGWRECS